MTANRVAWLAVLLLLLLIGGGFTYGWLKNFEPVSEQVRADMSPLARRNPWLAGERLLERFDMDVESQSGRKFLTTPPEEIGVLFVRDIGAPLPQSRQADLLAWVEQGGHLIVSPGIVFDDERGHPLLDQFGISRSEIGELLMGTLLAVAAVIVASGVAVLLWMALRRLFSRSGD